jgi:cytoskeleton protein RodZ
MNDAPEAEDDVLEAEPQAGERLAAARLALDISIADIAKALLLDEEKVVALEANHFDSLGPPVFAKGHMLKYAELVGVPVDDVLADYHQLTRSAGAPPVVGPKREPVRNFSPLPWIVGGVVIIAVAAAAWWWVRYAADHPVDAAQSAAPAVVAPTVIRSEVIQEAEEVVIDASAPEPAAESEVTSQPIQQEQQLVVDSDAVPAAALEAVDPADAVQLRMMFSGDCWTEVSDAAGRQLYFDLGTAGRVVTVAGEAPLRVLIGDSANISITVNGADYAIPTSNRADNTVRLTLNSQ